MVGSIIWIEARFASVVCNILCSDTRTQFHADASKSAACFGTLIGTPIFFSNVCAICLILRWFVVCKQSPKFNFLFSVVSMLCAGAAAKFSENPLKLFARLPKPILEEHKLDMDKDARDRKADQIVQEIGIPPCPATLTKLLRETRADTPDFRRVGQLIGGDVALASAVLKVANSPFYGLRTKASSVQQALALLGLNSVTQLVTGLLLRQAFCAVVGPGMERYWKSSMATSLIAAMLGRETTGGDVGVACTYGLFRDCGMPVMLQKFPIYADIFDGSALASGERVQEIENERYPANHASVGALLARSWHLPEPLCFAILHHHDLLYSNALIAKADGDALKLVAIGLVAEQIYRVAIGETCQEWVPAGEWALFELGLTQEKFATMVERVNASINRL